MINQTRTILLNRPAVYFDGITESEYISPSFAPVLLPSNMQRIHDVLFTPGLDKFSQNYVVASLLKILHTPELQAYTLYPDTRVTYTGDNTSLSEISDAPATMFFENFGSDVTPHYKVNSANYPQSLALAGEHSWFCTPVDSTTLSVQHNRQRTADSYAVLNGSTQSNMVELIPDYLSIFFTLPTQVLTTSFRVTYGLTLAPPYNIGEKIVELQQVVYQSGTFEQLFSAAPGYTEPLNQLRDAWASSVEITLRFGALVMAFVYYCDALRRGIRNG